MNTATTTSPKGNEPIFCVNRSAPPDIEPVLILGTLPDTRSELKCHYRWVPGLQIGAKYTHPSGKYEVDATPEYVKALHQNCQKMKANGFESPFVMDHKMGESPKTLGYGKDSRIERGWFWSAVQILGDDSLDVVRKNKISLGIAPTMKDGHRNVYAPALQHIAATNLPVVLNQPEMESVTAMSADDHGPIYCFSAAPDEPPATPAEVIQMAEKTTSLSPKHREEMLKAFSMDDGDAIDDEVLMSKHLDHHAALQRDCDKIDPFVSGMKNMSMASIAGEWGERNMPSLREEIGHLQEVATMAATERDALAGKVKTFSHENAAPDPEYLRGYADLAIGRIDLAMERGDMPGAIATRLKNAVLVGEKKEPSVFMLSLDSDLGERPIEFVLKLFNGAKLAPGSPEGVRTLSQEDDPNTKVDVNNPGGAVTNFDPKLNAQMIAAANGVGGGGVMTRAKMTRDEK